jgi:5'-3' exoribonuclease 1
VVVGCCRLLREYLEVEFNATVILPWGPIDIERVVDDFVLFCMLVGNDFLPGELVEQPVLC